MWKVLLATLALTAMAHGAFGQSPVVPTTRTAITTNGLVANFHSPTDAQHRLPAVIVIGGSGGGMDARTAWEAKALAEHGFATLELAYIGAAGLPTALHLFPLEYFKTAIDWLRAQPNVDPDRIGFVGTSHGGMVALLVAAHYPELKVVVAAVPSSVVWSSTGSSRLSMFSLAGQPLPFLPYGYKGGPGVHDLYDDGLNALDRHPEAAIPVERINGAVLVICGQLDSLWPSCRMSTQVIARLERNKFKHASRLLDYPEGGHFVFGPALAPESSTFAALGRAGGSPADNNAARIDSWAKAVAFMDAVLKHP